MIKALIASTLLVAVLFSVGAMTTATVLVMLEKFTPDQWLQSLSSCVTLCGLVVGKRAVDGVGKAVVAARNGDK